MLLNKVEEEMHRKSYCYDAENAVILLSAVFLIILNGNLSHIDSEARQQQYST